MTDELREWFRRVTDCELPDLPDKPRLGESSGDDRMWHNVAFFLFHIVQRGTATLRWADSPVLARKKPDPSWRAECEKAVQSARWLSGLIGSRPAAARIARPFIVQALQAGDALVQMEAALGVGDNEFRHGAFLRHRRDALTRASRVRDTAHPPIIAAMCKIRDANANRRRPLTFSEAARQVAVKNPRPNGTTYAPRTIQTIAKNNGVRW
jgi:hypothetical protein